MVRSWLAVVLATLVFIQLSGCTTPSSTSGAASGSQAEPAAATSAIEPLTPAQKRSMIASTFPAEVPVPDGEFLRAQAQGDGGWDYDVLVDATPAELAKWYRDAYMGRQWILLKEGEFDGEQGGGRFMEFRKGAAGSRVAVQGAESASGTRASVVVGVGTEVLITQ